MTRIIGIAGLAGAGKSTLVKNLLNILPNSSALFIDDYQRITREPVTEIIDWMERGGDFNEFVIPVAGEHLARLKSGETVLNPITLVPLVPMQFLLFETHFGRAHQDTGRHIDLMLWLDTPPEVALARNLLALLEPMAPGGKIQPTAERIGATCRFLSSYLQDVRRLTAFQRTRLLAEADRVLDGSLSSSDTAMAARLIIYGES